MNQFITSGSSPTAREAIINTFYENGDFLILGYGSLGGSTKNFDDDNKEIISHLKQALLRNKNLRVEIHVGVMFHYSDSECGPNIKLRKDVKSKKIRDKRYFKAFRPEAIDFLNNFDLALYGKKDKDGEYPNGDWKGLNHRIDLFLVPDFHSKFCLMTKEPYLTDPPHEDLILPPVAGVMGSSNLSSAAFSDARIEHDLYMRGGTENELLVDFSKSIAEALLTNKSRAVLRCDLVNRLAKKEADEGLSNHLRSITWWRDFVTNFHNGLPLSYDTYEEAAYNHLDPQGMSEHKSSIAKGEEQ